MLRCLTAATILATLAAAAKRDPFQPNDSKLEHYFVEENVDSTSTEHGCVVKRWAGEDAQGVTAPAHFASVVCPAGSTWNVTGWATGGISIYVWEGSVSVRGAGAATALSCK